MRLLGRVRLDAAGSSETSRPARPRSEVRAFSKENAQRLGDRCRDNKLWEEAARYYGEYLAEHPDDFAIWVQRGNCLKEAGSYPEAVEAYARAIALNRTEADVFLQRGHLEKRLGHREEAILSYRTSLELQPRDNDALRELIGLGAQAEAAEVLRKAGPPLRVAMAEPPPTGDGATNLENTRLPGGKRPRILYISDSLGTPVHARGIFNYSIAMVEMLASLGIEITLVVEMADGYSPERRGKKDNGTTDRLVIPRKPGKYHLTSEALNSWLLSEVYRYFTGNKFTFDIPFRNQRLQRLYERAPELVRFVYRAYASLTRRRGYVITNSDDRVEYIPPAGAHLRKFDRLLYLPRFYSDSMSRAVKGLVPVRVGAAGYDAVIFDTPHYVRVDGIAHSRIFTVVHDLIPLRDPFMSSDWRVIFLAKLSMSLKRKENLIFVSEYTRSLFYSQFPAHKPKRDVVVHPTIRSEQIAQAHAIELPSKSSYLRRISEDRAYHDKNHIKDRANRMSDNPAARNALIKEFEKTLGGWDGALPYFATVVSDEPRKNIKIFCEISPDFVGRCNFIIMGQVNGNSYMHQEPELYPNLHFTGYISDRDKAEILRHATGIIFPSLAEGFGIPIVEGALFGIPILCSDIPVFREITDNLAVYFDPYRPDELSFKIGQVLEQQTAYTEAAQEYRDLVSRRFCQEEMQKRLRQVLSDVGVLPTFDEGRAG